jgi:hypothetical protein
MKAAPLLHFVLGIWLGGSVIVSAVVSYNLAGFDDLFDRNPRLQERAGFTPDDAITKKSSLLWVHASELNRVFFEVWNRSQLVLGGLAVLLAVWARSGRLVVVLLILATVLVAILQMALQPQLVELGRQLDFAPRDPPPPGLDDFQRYHGLYFGAESLRLGLVGLAALLSIARGMRADGG